MKIGRALIIATFSILLASEAALAELSPNPDPAHITRADGSPAQAGDEVIRLSPRDDPERDGDNLQWSVDAIAEGGTVLLQEGTFRLGKTRTAVDLSVRTATGTFQFVSDFYAVGFAQAFDDPESVLDQRVDIRKTVTIRGAAGGMTARPDGRPMPELRTTIAAPAGLEWEYGGSLVLEAPGIHIERVRFADFNFALFAFAPGFDVRECEFRRCAHPAYLLPDVDRPGSSAFRDNLATESVLGLHVVGNDVSVTDNYLSCTDCPAAMAILPWTAFWDLPINWDSASRNVIARNTIVTAGRTGWLNFGMGAIDLTGWSGGIGATENDVTENTFLDDGTGAPFVALAGPGADANRLIMNDYRATLAPGWTDFEGGAVWIDPACRENFVVERNFPAGTDLCEQILDADDFDGPLIRRDRATGIFFDLRTEGLVLVDGIWTPLGDVLPVYGAASQYVESGNAFFERANRPVRSPYSTQMFNPFLPVFGPVVVPKNTHVPGWEGLCD